MADHVSFFWWMLMACWQIDAEKVLWKTLRNPLPKILMKKTGLCQVFLNLMDTTLKLCSENPSMVVEPRWCLIAFVSMIQLSSAHSGWQSLEIGGGCIATVLSSISLMNSEFVSPSLKNCRTGTVSGYWSNIFQAAWEHYPNDYLDSFASQVSDDEFFSMILCTKKAMVKSPKFPSCINLLSLSAAVSSSKPPPLGGGLLLPPLHRCISNVDARHSPALHLVGIFGQSKLNGSVIGGFNQPPFQKMCARQNWIMNPPGFGVGWNFQQNALKFHVMEISTFLEQPETGQGASVAAPTQNWWFWFCLSGLPWPPHFHPAWVGPFKMTHF